jgi:hypothetical protein
MYRPSDIKANLTDLWGWRQNYDVEEFTIADSLTETTTGQYYQEIHPLVTLDNIKALAPDFKNITYPTWLIGTQYRVGDRVTLAASSYRAKMDSIGQTPETNPTQWERFDAFSEWLENKTEASVLKAIRSFWDAKMADNEMRNILENKTLFNGTGRIKDLIPNGSNFVGFELVPIRANGITLKVDKIGLQFSEAQEVVLYLYHSSRSQPVRTETLTRTRDGGIQWFDFTDFLLPYASSDIDSGGSWYLVYDQTAISTGQAISKDKDWSQKPCGTCDRNEVSAHRVWSKYLEVHPFKIAASKIVAGEIWDVADNLYTYETNYGLNLQITIECDLTDIIIQQKKAFQNIIGMQVGIDMLREMAFNPSFKIGRAQQNPSFSKMDVLYELDGDSQGYKKSGLRYEFDKAMKAVSLDTKNLSRVCTPCNNRGLKYRTT